jgi:methionine salvage enolase-phosphatase E1
MCVYVCGSCGCKIQKLIKKRAEALHLKEEKDGYMEGLKGEKGRGK